MILKALVDWILPSDDGVIGVDTHVGDVGHQLSNRYREEYYY